MNFENSNIHYLLLLLKVTTVFPFFYEIGIYSNCTGKSNRTQMNMDAGLVSDFNTGMMKGAKDAYGLQNNVDFFYPSFTFDVCDNFTLLAEIVQNLILAERFHQTFEGVSYSSIENFFMYTPLEMSNFVKNVFTQTPVYDIDHRIQEEGSIYNPVDGFVENLILVAEFVGWKKLTLISLTNFEFPYLMYFRKTVKALQRMKVCLEFYHIDPQMDINEIEFVNRIPNTTEQINVVILFGSWWHQENFLNKIFAIFGRLPFSL